MSYHSTDSLLPLKAQCPRELQLLFFTRCCVNELKQWLYSDNQNVPKADLASMSLPSPPSFLTLPRELRDEIYISLLLQSKLPPPASPSEAGPLRKLAQFPFFIHQRMYYTDTLPPIPSLSLLSCCRQTRREVQATLGRKDLAERRRATVYELDCMVQDSNAWPTWTRLPGSLARVHMLEVNLRFFPSRAGRRPADGFRFRPVLYLLQRLLLYGARFCSAEARCPEIRIEVLVLSVAREAVMEAAESDMVDDLRDDQTVQRRLRRIWEPFLTLERYGLLSGKVGKLRLYCDGWVKEVNVQTGNMVATGESAWKAWMVRHRQF